MNKIAKHSPGHDKIITDKYWHQSYDVALKEMKEFEKGYLESYTIMNSDYFGLYRVIFIGQEEWINNQPHNK